MTEPNTVIDDDGSTAVSPPLREGSGEIEGSREYVGALEDRRHPVTAESDASNPGVPASVAGKTRRRFLVAVTAVSAGGLAGCSDSSDGDDGETPTSDAEDGADGDSDGSETDTPDATEGVRLPAADLAALELGAVGFTELSVTLPGDDGGS